MSKLYEVIPQELALAGDSAELVYGARLANVKGCTDCHGKDLGGKIFIDNAALGYLPARNLTDGSVHRY